MRRLLQLIKLHIYGIERAKRGGSIGLVEEEGSGEDILAVVSGVYHGCRVVEMHCDRIGRFVKGERIAAPFYRLV